MSLLGGLARLVAVTLVTATGAALPTALPTAAPAQAADACRPGHGVTVVVDFHRLRHDDVRACVPAGGGHDAATLLHDAGLSLADVQRQPGFVCRIDGLPADDPCVNTPPADAYWALWWSDGSSGEWTYSTVMASSLDVPDGGFVGMVWQQGSAETRPSVRPAAGGPGAPVATPAASGARAGQADATAAADDGGALPAWVAPAAVGLLLAGAAGTAVVRRRRAGRPS